MIPHIIIAMILSVNPPDGTVIFLTQIGKPSISAKLIEKTTKENISHVAIILYDSDNPYVYESTIPGGVQKSSLEEFYEKLNRRSYRHPERGLQPQLIPPIPQYTKQELIVMKKYANSQLGKPYMVKGYWKDQEVRGLHCSQYVGNIIGKTGRIVSENQKETPASLFLKIWNSELESKTKY